MTRVLVITGASVGPRMSGPAIRASAMARVLAADGHDVTLLTTGSLAEGWSPAGYAVASIGPTDRRAFARFHAAAEVVVFQGHATEQFPALARSRTVLVADAYDPMHLEMLEQGRSAHRATWDLLVDDRVRLLNQQLAHADLVLAASPRQRQLYLGQLAALGRVSPRTYRDDPHLERLIALAPFGLDAEPPAASDTPRLRGAHPAVPDDARILVWGGGVYDWFDPLTLIRAVHGLSQRRPQVRLVFLGTVTPGLEPRGIVRDAIELARELGAFDRSVVFNEGWIPFDERGAYYAEADAAVSTHHDHLETEFSFRTRILDYLWAGLPMVVTEGDHFADLVRERELGVVVPAGDAAALEEALERILFDEQFASRAAARVAAVREEFVWERTLEPLRALAREPRLAADAAASGRAALGRRARSLVRPPVPLGLRRRIRDGLFYARRGALSEVSRRWKSRRRP